MADSSSLQSYPITSKLYDVGTQNGAQTGWESGVDMKAGVAQSKFAVLIMIIVALGTWFVQASVAAAQLDGSLSALEQSFANPPDDCRIMVRWWWFGPAVTKPELQRELDEMKAEGIGGVEIATLYPLALDDPKTGFHNQRFLSDEHLDAIRFAATAARKLGLRVDITLGSGWPF